jgi:hypothetical protein
MLFGERSLVDGAAALRVWFARRRDSSIAFPPAVAML